MRTFYENDIRRRVKFLSFLLAVWGLLIAARLVQVQVLGHARARVLKLQACTLLPLTEYPKPQNKVMPAGWELK